jgi:hypothetical protein
MTRKLDDPFTREAPLSSEDEAILTVFTSLMNMNGASPLAPPEQAACSQPGQLCPPILEHPKPWGKLTRDNWNSHEACRRDNVRCIFDLSPSSSPLPEFTGKTPAIYEGFGFPCSKILSIDECRKFYGYDPQSNETCSPEILRLRVERCVELRLRYPDDLSAIDMHEHHSLRGDNVLHLRFWQEFPADGREITIKLLCHERKMTREQAEQHLAKCASLRPSP